MSIKEMLENVIKNMVDHEEHVKLIETKGENINSYELSVHEEDVGKVLGKEGKNIKAIRTILVAASTKQRTKSILEVITNRKKN